MSMPYLGEMPRMPETLTLSDYPEKVKKLLPNPESKDPPNCSPIVAAVIFQLLNYKCTELDVSSPNVNAEPNKNEPTIQIVTTQNPKSLYYPEGWYYDGGYLVKGVNRRGSSSEFHPNEYYCIPIIREKGE